MWTRIVLLLVGLIALSFVLQWLLPKRQRGRRITVRQYMMWDIAPLIGFSGVVFTGLAMLEAMRQSMMLNWVWGNLLGILGGIAISFALMQSFRAPSLRAPAQHKSLATGRFPALRIVFLIVKRYGLLILIAWIALELVVRWFGAALEVLLTSGLGALLLVFALAVFVRARWQDPRFPEH